LQQTKQGLGGGGGGANATQSYFLCDHIKARSKQVGNLVLYANVGKTIIAWVKQTKVPSLTRKLSVAVAVTMQCPSNKLRL